MLEVGLEGLLSLPVHLGVQASESDRPVPLVPGQLLKFWEPPPGL